MWLSAEPRHIHRQTLCKLLQHNCSPCEECNTCVVLMVPIDHRILGANYRRNISNVTRHLGDGKHVILRQIVRGSVRAVRAVRNTQVFMTESRVITDAATPGALTSASKYFQMIPGPPGALQSALRLCESIPRCS